MTEITAEGPVSTTTVIDGKNGTVPMPHVKVSKKVSEEFATTFSSPAAWLLVAALIVTWSAVAIVMFDLVDYKTLAGIHQLDIDKELGKAEIPRGQSVNKLTTDPLRLVHGAVEDTTDWVYGFLSLLTDLIFEDEDESERGEVAPSLKIKEGIQPPVKKKEIHIDKSEKPEKTEKKPPPKEIQTDKPVKQEKIEKKPPPKAIPKEKPEKPEKPERPEKPEKAKKPEKPEKVEKPGKREISKAIHKEKPERHEKPEKKEKPDRSGKPERPEKVGKAKEPPKEKPAKEEKPKKKAVPSPKDKKSIKVEDKAKKDVKERKPEPKAPERVKHKETKAEVVAPAKVKAKEETALVVTEKSEKKDQYAFCRYMIDMFSHGDLYTGPPPHLWFPQTPAMTPAIPAVEVGKPNVTTTKPIKEEKAKKVVQQKKAIPEIKTKEVEEKKKVTHEKKVIPEIKKKVKKEERKKAHEKTAVPEVKKADKKEAVLTKDLKKPAKAPAAQPASVKVAAPEPHKKEKPVETAKLPKKDVPVKAAVAHEAHKPKVTTEVHKPKAVHEKKEDRPLKVVEKEKPKPKESKDAKEKEIKHHPALKDKDAAKEKVKPPVAAKEKEPAIKKEVSLPKTGKKVEHKPPKQDSLKHDKEVPQVKTAKPKETKKPSAEITVAAKKKETPLKEKEGKKVEKPHFKEKKVTVPAVKETHYHHNVTTDKISKAARAKGHTDLSATKKDKSAVRYYQCVFVNGYNGHKSQHPVTPAQDYKGKAGQPKTSGPKTKAPKQ
ncbi:triadin isoform X6 [Zootoca vivipara]|uniref:triadin isoform X6 n=1 Tax=Zootoca vivipara TaxID=8524 RepID=UPI001591F538|nr:triadin isoform X6 [Zootoca vivipara]